MPTEQQPIKTNKPRKKPNRRHRARAFALQAIYQWHVTHEVPNNIVTHFLEEHAEKINAERHMDVDYFQSLVVGTIENIDSIDARMTPFLDRPLAQLNPVELAVLRLAIHELIKHPEVPQNVVLNEAIELTKEFGATDGYKFVNAVLNALIKAP